MFPSYHPGLEGFIHLYWLKYLALPIIVYFSGPSLFGCGIPLLISLLLTRRFWRNRKSVLKNNSIDAKYYNLGHAGHLILGLWCLGILASIATEYWTSVGLHFYPFSEIIWPLLALISRRGFIWWLSYPLTFSSAFIADFYGAGQSGHWVGDFWFGVGGAGFHDGLFITPLVTLIMAGILHYVGAFIYEKRQILAFALN